MTYTSKSAEETAKLAKTIAKQHPNIKLFYLTGEIGSGKTVFAKSLAEAFGIEDFKVKSPTYTYIREYTTHNQKFYHIDLYRIEEVDDLLEMEINEIMESPNNIVIIEWAERLLLKNTPRVEVHFTQLDVDQRNILVRKH